MPAIIYILPFSNSIHKHSHVTNSILQSNKQTWTLFMNNMEFHLKHFLMQATFACNFTARLSSFCCCYYWLHHLMLALLMFYYFLHLAWFWTGVFTATAINSKCIFPCLLAYMLNYTLLVSYTTVKHYTWFEQVYLLLLLLLSTQNEYSHASFAYA